MTKKDHMTNYMYFTWIKYYILLLLQSKMEDRKTKILCMALIKF